MRRLALSWCPQVLTRHPDSPRGIKTRVDLGFSLSHFFPFSTLLAFLHQMHNRNRVSQQQRQHQQQHQQQFEIQRKQAKAERVRKLWVEFELWLKQPRNDMERERDQLFFQTGRVTSAAVKASRRRIEGTHFHKAREEWQRRLRGADLRESDWDPMHEAEMKAVEEALGVDDEEGYITDPSPSPPHQILPVSLLDHSANKTAPSPSSLLPPQPSLVAAAPAPAPQLPPQLATAPPLTAASRTSSSSSYECVRPEEFHSEDDEELTPDSDYSSFSSTISTIVSPFRLFTVCSTPLTVIPGRFRKKMKLWVPSRNTCSAKLSKPAVSPDARRTR